MRTRKRLTAGICAGLLSFGLMACEAPPAEDLEDPGLDGGVEEPTDGLETGT